MLIMPDMLISSVMLILSFVFFGIGLCAGGDNGYSTAKFQDKVNLFIHVIRIGPNSFRVVLDSLTGFHLD